MGKIVTTSDMIVSGSSDGLFFRHQKKEEDYRVNPEWVEQVIFSFIYLFIYFLI